MTESKRIQLNDAALNSQVKIAQIEAVVIGKVGTGGSGMVWLATNAEVPSFRPITSTELAQWVFAAGKRYITVESGTVWCEAAPSTEEQVATLKARLSDKLMDAKLSDKVEVVIVSDFIQKGEGNYGSEHSFAEGTIISKGDYATIGWGNSKPGFKEFDEVEDLSGHRYQTRLSMQAPCRIIKPVVDKQPEPVKVAEEAKRTIVKATQLKLGDVVNVLVDERRRITDLTGPVNRVRAVVLAVRKVDASSSYDQAFLGFEVQPDIRGVSERSGLSPYHHYLPNQAEYKWYVELDANNEVELVGTEGVERIDSESAVDKRPEPVKVAEEAKPTKAIEEPILMSGVKASDLKPGDMINLYVDANNRLSKTKTSTRMHAEVLAVRKAGLANHSHVMLGWRQKPGLIGVDDRGGISPDHDYVSNQADYLWLYRIGDSDADTEVEVISHNPKEWPPSPQATTSPAKIDPITSALIRGVIKPLFEVQKTETEAAIKLVGRTYDDIIKELADKVNILTADVAKLKAKTSIPTFLGASIPSFQPGDRVHSQLAGISATVVGIITAPYQSYVVLGWKEGETAPPEASRNYALYSGEQMTCVSDIHSYKHYIATTPFDMTLFGMASVAPENTETVSVRYGDALASKVGDFSVETAYLKAKLDASVIDKAKLAAVPEKGIDFHLGDRVSIELDFKTYEATVAGVISEVKPYDSVSFVVLAWKEGEAAPTSADHIYSLLSPEQLSCLTDMKSFKSYRFCATQGNHTMKLVSKATSISTVIAGIQKNSHNALASKTMQEYESQFKKAPKKDESLKKPEPAKEAEPAPIKDPEPNEVEPTPVKDPEPLEEDKSSAWPMIVGAALGGLVSAMTQSNATSVRVEAPIPEALTEATESVLEAAHG